MGRITGLIILIFVVFIYVIPTRVEGQSTSRTASPPVVRIDLSGQEPPPPGVKTQLSYSGGGAGGIGLPETTKPFWIFTPKEIDQGGFLIACGYRAGATPKSILTTPHGTEARLAPLPLTTIAGIWGDRFGIPKSPQDIAAEFRQSGCIGYGVYFTYGMMLGKYTLTLSHAQGDLSYSWTIDYPFCTGKITLDVSSHRMKDMLMSFTPQTTYTIHFYSRFSDISFQGQHQYIATRTFTTDSEGAVLLDINLARSAPFTFNQKPAPYLAAGAYAGADFVYTVFNSKGKLVFVDPFWLDPGLYRDMAASGVLVMVPQPKYPTYRMPDYGEFVDIRIPVKDFQGKLVYSLDTDPLVGSCSGEYGYFAQVVPQTGDQLPLYANFEDTSTIVAQIPAGEPVEVLDHKAGLVNNRTVSWTHIRTEDNREGWAYGPNFTTIIGSFIPGGTARVVAFDSKKVWLRQEPADADEGLIKELNAGDVLNIIRLKRTSIKSGSKTRYQVWAFVQTEDNQYGWIRPASDNYDQPSQIIALPWKPFVITDEMNAAAGPTDTPTPLPTARPTIAPRPTSTPAWNCSSALSSRLTVGGQGKVVPPKSNRVRAEPNGEIIGKIDVGTVFNVIDGPCQTADQTIWWKITYQELTGWTAEGKGTEYWVKPAN
jgi:hypothetical protein